MVYLDGAWCAVDCTYGDGDYLGKGISYSWFGVPLDVVKPVSYTHLDVYKRQSDVFPTLQGRVCKGISLKYIVIGGIDVSGTRS